MPGLLKMEEPDTPQTNGKHVTQPATLTNHIEAPAAQEKKTEGFLATNGGFDDMAEPSKQAHPHPNGGLPLDTTMTSDALFDGAPPELPHVSQGFHSLGDLISRVTQESFNNMTTVMEDMSRIRLPYRPAQTLANGAGAVHVSPDDTTQDSRENQEKKRKFLEWAQTTRERLIKLLVLTTWSARIGDLRKLMDVLAYLRDTDQIYWQTAHSVGEIKRNMHPFKLPAPNLRHAAEVLSRGSAAWMGEFYNYLPRRPLSPADTLKTMKNMEVLLNTRFVLHEDLEPGLRDYRIANGRATFTFPGEFELDVTLASEDMMRQLYFLDLRFSFDPAPDVGSTRTRERLESKVNELLGVGGLPAACDFLRSFTLTHKITVFRKQAADLQTSYWNKMLKVDQIHRSLIVNYWLESPMPKSWIEIGVSSGKSESGQSSSLRAAQSRLSLRWFRTVKSMAERDSPSMDLKQLSLENILKQTIASHTIHLLRSLQHQLLRLAGGKRGNLRTEIKTSPTEPTDCVLQIELGKLLQPVKVGVEPISGKLFISPTHRRADRMARDLSSMKDPTSEVAGLRMVRYIYGEIQHLVRQRAERRRWLIKETRSLTPSHLKQVIGKDVHVISIFQPIGWSVPGWVAVLVIDSSAESWYTAKLSKVTTADGQQEDRLSVVRQLSIPDSTVSQYCVDVVEQIAVREIAMHSAAQDLAARGAHSQHAASRSPTNPSHSAGVGGTIPTNGGGIISTQPSLQQPSDYSLLFKLSHLIPDLVTSTPSFGDLAFISYSSFNPATSRIILTLSGTILDSYKVIKALAGVKDQSMTIHKDGRFVLNLAVELGEAFVDKALSSLRTLARMRYFAIAIQKHRFKLSNLSAQDITFWYPSDYAKSGRCNLSCTLIIQKADTNSGSEKADVIFGQGSKAVGDSSRSGAAEDSITISMSPSNPHHHIVGLLQSYLGSKSRDGPAALMDCLIVTWPLCLAFREMETGRLYEHPRSPLEESQEIEDASVKSEADDKGAPDQKAVQSYLGYNPHIHAHRPDSWKLTYSHPPSTWLLVLRPFRDQVLWQISEAPYPTQHGHASQALFSRDPNGASRGEDLARDLRILFAMGNTGPGWRGYRTLITADQATGVTAALRSLHAVLMKHAASSTDQSAGPTHEGLIKNEVIANSIEDKAGQDKKKAGASQHRHAASGSRADAIRID